MTREEFEKSMDELKYKEAAVRREMRVLQNKYVSEYPIHPDDKCVDIDGKVCWLVKLSFTSYDSVFEGFIVNYAKKDGTRSKQEKYVYSIKPFKE